MSQAHCQNCGAAYPVSAGGIVGRTATCESCGRDLHACVNCTFYDPKAYNECHEPNAERVDNRKASNFCDYFKPVPTKPAAPGQSAAAQREQSARDKLNSLFKKPES